MGREALWAVRLLLNSRLWGTCLSQRPRWYYGGLEPPSGMQLDLPQQPLDTLFKTQALLWYSYWIIIGTLGTMVIWSVIFFIKQMVNAQKQQESKPPWQEDTEEAELMDALHLLDIMLDKTLRHLRRLERRRGRRRDASHLLSAADPTRPE